MHKLNRTLGALAFIALTTPAWAQSSVTLFGTADAAVIHVKGTTSKTGVSSGGANISRFGFRGVEDLGGGLKAGFWLEAGMDVDTGVGKGANGSMSFNRRSFVHLNGSFGEIRLGRDDAFTFLNVIGFDPFLTNGVGGTMALVMQGAPISTPNAVSYYLPGNLGGFYGQVQRTFGEAAAPTGNKGEGNYTSGLAGYRSGPFHASLAVAKVKGASDATDLDIRNAGASYDFGSVKPMFLYAVEEKGSTKITATQIGLFAPVGLGEWRASIGFYDTANSQVDWRKYAIGYGYNLSKRTQVYGAYARVVNKAGAQKSIGPQGFTAPGTSLGGNVSGVNVGIRHFF